MKSETPKANILSWNWLLLYLHLVRSIRLKSSSRYRLADKLRFSVERWSHLHWRREEEIPMHRDLGFRKVIKLEGRSHSPCLRSSQRDCTAFTHFVYISVRFLTVFSPKEKAEIRSRDITSLTESTTYIKRGNKKSIFMLFSLSYSVRMWGTCARAARGARTCQRPTPAPAVHGNANCPLIASIKTTTSKILNPTASEYLITYSR